MDKIIKPRKQMLN